MVFVGILKRGDYMNLINQKVCHITLGCGEIVEQTDKIVTVQFASKISKFQYPSAFQKFLRALNTDIQTVILQQIEDNEVAARAKEFVEEEIRYTDISQKKEKQHIICSSSEIVMDRFKTSKEKHIRQNRASDKRMVFFVFQGSTYNREKNGGYIWAPIANKAGKRFHHWDKLLDVRSGDIILHGCDGYIKAISEARCECYECTQPEELYSEKMWEREGRRIDCDYTTIECPIKTAMFREDIIRLCNVKYAPFDKDGNGNMGYLYEINLELARIFIKGLIKGNKYLEKIEYVRNFLMEDDIT